MPPDSGAGTPSAHHGRRNGPQTSQSGGVRLTYSHVIAIEATVSIFNIVMAVWLGTVLVVHVCIGFWSARAFLRYVRAVTLARIAAHELPPYYETWPSWALANAPEMRRRFLRSESDPHLESLRRAANRRHRVAVLLILVHFAGTVAIFTMFVLAGPSFHGR